MVSPPLPMTVPIRSGSILIAVMRGAHADSSVRGLGERLGHDPEDVLAPGLRLGERVAQDVEGDAGDLDVHLQRVDALGGAGHLEVHVAEVVLVALDVGEHDVVVALLDQAHRDAGHRPGDRHAGVQQREGRAADRRHRRGAVALQRLGDEPQRVRELDVVRDHRQQGPLGQRAVTDVAALGAAHEAGLAHAEGREVVVVDVALGGLDAEAVDALRLLGGAQREAGEHLGLAAGEQAGAVHARQHADLALDGPDLVGGATVGALLVDRDALADDALLERVEGPAEGRVVLRVGVGAQHGLGGGEADRGDLVAAQQLGLLEGGLVEVLAGGLLDRLQHLLVHGQRRDVPLGLAGHLLELELRRRRGCGSPRGRSAGPRASCPRRPRWRRPRPSRWRRRCRRRPGPARTPRSPAGSG